MQAQIEQQLVAALDQRQGQRGFVADLVTAWQELAARFNDMVSALQEIERALPDMSHTVEGTSQIRESVARALLGGPSGSGQSVDDLRIRLRTAGHRIAAVQQRVLRDTVNLGVVGMTRAGKSTLLKTITDLPPEVVPSEEFLPTTAVPSRIYHRPGAPSAVLHLHDWPSFRDSYLAPLHDQARLGPPPPAQDEFATYRYPQPASTPGESVDRDKYLRKLLSAQRSFGSYRPLLRGGELEKPLPELRAFIAYPLPGESDSQQPYHAVRFAHIFQQFKNLTVTRLGLVDLPGRGEAGLDVERKFLQALRTEVDLLLMVKRPDVNSAFLTDEDSKTIALADEARSGVPLEHFLRIVINRDPQHLDPRYVDNAVTAMRHDAPPGVTVVATDVIDQAEVFATLIEPCLNHLAGCLAEMDRAAVRNALEQADGVRADIARFAEELSSAVDEWLQVLPDQGDVFHEKVMRLYWKLARNLARLRDRYDSLVVAKQANAELEKGISAAAGEARDWVRSGLGMGSRESWVAEMEGRFAAGEPEAMQDEYNRARAKMTQIFNRIDTSLKLSVASLHGEVAQELREAFTAQIVPDSDNALDELRKLTLRSKARTIHDALAELANLEVKYGSIVLRVARPILRRIHWDEATSSSSGPSMANQVLGAASEAVINTAVSTPLGVPVAAPGMAIANWWTRQPPASNAPVTDPRSTDSGSLGESESEKARRGVEQLYDELTTVVSERIEELDDALHKEARVMALALAAAADQFFDRVIRTNEVERDYKKICRPYQQDLWPEIFDGRDALVATEISRVAEQARRLLDAAEDLAGRGIALQRQVPLRA